MNRKNTWMSILFTILTLKAQASTSWQSVMKCSNSTDSSMATVYKNTANQLIINLELTKTVDENYKFLKKFMVNNSYVLKNLQAQREEMNSNSIYIAEKNYRYFLNFNAIDLSALIMIHDPANIDDFTLPLLCRLEPGFKITGAGKNISFTMSSEKEWRKDR